MITSLLLAATMVPFVAKGTTMNESHWIISILATQHLITQEPRVFFLPSTKGATTIRLRWGQGWGQGSPAKVNVKGEDGRSLKLEQLGKPNMDANQIGDV